MSDPAAGQLACPRCGAPLAADVARCPICGMARGIGDPSPFSRGWVFIYLGALAATFALVLAWVLATR